MCLGKLSFSLTVNFQSVFYRTLPPPPYHKLKFFTNLSPVNEIKINEQTYISNKITKRGKAILKFAIYKVVTIRHCTYRLSAAILQMLQIASVY